MHVKIKDAELRLCLSCIASATGCWEGILRCVPRRCERVRSLEPTLMCDDAGIKCTTTSVSGLTESFMYRFHNWVGFVVFHFKPGGACFTVIK